MSSPKKKPQPEPPPSPRAGNLILRATPEYMIACKSLAERKGFATVAELLAYALDRVARSERVTLPPRARRIGRPRKPDAE